MLLLLLPVALRPFQFGRGFPLIMVQSHIIFLINSGFYTATCRQRTSNCL